MSRKIFFALLFAIIATGGYSQRTDYYRWDKTYQENGAMKKETANEGLFITRQGNICFDSDNEGYSVSNGNMKLSHTATDYTVYTGPCYYGQYCEYVFYDIEGILNIVHPNGTTYVFVREAPPAGRTTCSLIKKNESSEHIIIEPLSDGAKRNNVKRNSGSNNTPKIIDCPVCKGTGRVKQPVPQTSGFGVDVKYTRCNECGETSMTRHIHINCKHCRGGKITIR